MPTVLTEVIYGADKKISLDKFNIGSLTKAVTFDLEEFGKRGVQGLVIKSTEAVKAVAAAKSNSKLSQPYVIAGLCKADLVFLVRDQKDPKFEEVSILVKDYVGVKEELKKSSAAVVNLHEGNQTIDKAAAAQADRFKTNVQSKDDADFGNVTGNVLLCAHGTPKVNVGFVIGTALGQMSPVKVADLLTRNPEKSRRLAKDYSGRITLSGCFTASGGPAALEQDDPFAKKVLDELKKRGFDKCSVVGMPGIAMTAREDNANPKGIKKDGDGVTFKRGEKGVWAKGQQQLEALSLQSQKQRKELDKLVDGLVKAGKTYKGDKSIFLGTDAAKKVLLVIQAKENALTSTRDEMKSIEADIVKYKDVDGKLSAHVTGTFGLRVVKRDLGIS